MTKLVKKIKSDSYFFVPTLKDKVNFKHHTEPRRLIIRNFFGNLQSNYKIPLVNMLSSHSLLNACNIFKHAKHRLCSVGNM